MEYQEEYVRWCSHVTDQRVAEQLREMTSEEMEEAFYRNLAFGTGGLRGKLGAGTNRMNIYTVAKASQGLANYLLKHNAALTVVIGYDSRLQSDEFSRTAASVFAENRIRVHIWSVLNPVPTVSFAIRMLGASAGVMITASHNPAQYNGYKVYGADGCQITSRAAAEILTEIEQLDIFTDVKIGDHTALTSSGWIQEIPDCVMSAYIEAVKQQSVLFGDPVDRDVKIVYSPLNGTGRVPVQRVLREAGYRNIQVVAEQEMPDGNFPTCPYPNPEIPEAMQLGLENARKSGADLLLATDPDCDRVGIAVKNACGEYVLLSGNETGILLLDYICAQRVRHGMMPDGPVMVKTIVTMDLGERIAAHYGVETRNVLTGFKYIGEQIGLLEKEGRANRYIFGFEESYGYLSGTYVRDKDGVNAAFLICEMFSFYKTRGIRLTDKLEELYRTYGYCLNTLHSWVLEGAAGYARMQELMGRFRSGMNQIASQKVLRVVDYAQGIEGLPKSDVLKFFLAGNSSFVVRPSGTEPKLKIYISVSAENRAKAEQLEMQIAQILEKIIMEKP